MNIPAEKLKFYDIGNPKRNKENFQGYLFYQINQKKAIQPISFYRSDFRDVKIKSCQFFKNNFSRADFIDSVIEKTLFQECIFQYSEFFNCYFESSTFNDSRLKSTSINGAFFNECKLYKGKFSDITIRDCSFKKCHLENISFIKNSIDNIKFDECSLTNLDFSNMTAINLYFDNCNFSNLTIDADSIGTYFFKKTYLEATKLKYRGKTFEVEMDMKELLENLFKLYLNGNRYYESINLFVQISCFFGGRYSVKELIVVSIQRLLLDPNVVRRSYQTTKIFQLLEFYFNDGCISIDDYFAIISFMEQIDITNLELNERISLFTLIQRLKNLFEVFELSDAFIDSTKRNIGLIEFTIDEKNEELFLSLFESLIDDFYDSKSGSKAFFIIGRRKGSVILEIVMEASTILLLLRILKSGLKQIRAIGNESIQILIDFTINRKLLAQAKKAKNIEKIKQIQELRIEAQKADNTSRVIEPKKISSLISTIKSVRYMPNAFTESD